MLYEAVCKSEIGEVRPGFGSVWRVQLMEILNLVIRLHSGKARLLLIMTVLCVIAGALTFFGGSGEGAIPDSPVRTVAYVISC